MFKITNTRQLGTIYTITDSNGDPLDTIQVINSEEILNAALGAYDDTFLNYSDYLTQSIECLSGFDENALYRTLWWTRPAVGSSVGFDYDLDLAQSIEHAIRYGYDAIIIEDIPATE